MTMKIKAKLILIAFILTGQFSCSDWLDLQPPQGLTREEFWQTKEDVDAAVMGAYHALADMNDLLFKYGEMRGDLVVYDDNLSGEERDIMDGSIYPDNGMCNWEKFYKLINYCNEIIYFAPGVQGKDETFTDYLLYGYLSEAYFLRSLSYFYLVRVFKEVPLVLEPTLTDATNVYPEKSTEEEVLAQIRQDLLTARSWATVDGYITMAENKGRATKGAFDALLADIALWSFDYEGCLTHIQNLELLNKYEVLRGEDWFELFYPGNTLEGIFEVQFEDSWNEANGLYGLTNFNSRNYDPSDYAIELFDNEDPAKRDLWRGVDKSIREESKDDYIIWKYVGLAGDGETPRPYTVQNSANLIIYRLSDVFLMKAEALSQLGRYNEALDAIMEVRGERGLSIPDKLTNNATSYEDAILEERARELAFEGKRWFDLLRMGRRNNYARKSNLISIMVRNVPSTQKRILQTKLNNPLSWYLPIYKLEMERNKNLVQNPYYNF
jgi:hypothetical protein